MNELLYRTLHTALRLGGGMVAVIALLMQCARADQVGIDKVRLIETSDDQYWLEVDTVPRFIAAYRDPIFPERFELIESLRERQAGCVALRYRFRSRGMPLSPEDELLLPWGRAGASVTAQWSDGSIHQNLFLRNFEGIRVPIELLTRSSASRYDIAKRNVRAGFLHSVVGPNHWLLISAIVLAAAGWGRLWMVISFAAGQAISLTLVDVRLFVVTGEVAEVCTVVVALLLVRAALLTDNVCRGFEVVLVFSGVLHGLSAANDLRQSDLGSTTLVENLFWFHFGVDLMQLFATAVLGGIAGLIFKLTGGKRFFQTAVGGTSFGLLLLALTGGSVTGGEDGPEDQISRSFELPDAQLVLPGQGNRPQPPSSLNQPLACFLALDSYETRLEVLVRLSAANQWIELPPPGSKIDIDDQPKLKQSVLEFVTNGMALVVNGEEQAPDLQDANFVTVEPNGVFTRATPVAENIDTAVVGVTFTYDTGALPEAILLECSLFESGGPSITATITDPFGGKQQELTPDQPRLTWKSRWSGYKPPEIKPVVALRPQFPLASVVLVLVAVLIYRSSCKQPPRRFKAGAIVVVLVMAWVSYPFARVSFAAPLVASWRVSDERSAEVMTQLLTNVYRAYDMRDEEAIYDRLARTVTGEQLTEIYLDTRRSLELENRAGARAKVDQVVVQEVHGTDAVGGDGIVVDLTWTVSGSVTHFGHTHYRRNRYRALVTIVPVDGAWKLQAIQVGEQQRIL